MRRAATTAGSPGRAAVIIALIAAAAVVAAAATVAVLRLRSPLPPPEVRVSAPSSLVLAPGTRPGVPAPAAGSFLLMSDRGERLSAFNEAASRPIGSVAKVMTALVVLQAKPLAPAEDGPSLTLTDQDVAFYNDVVAAGGSAVLVEAGETLTERQMLQALMLPSANNMAETLAVWVSGSVDAFVARENAEAATLHLAATHFDDPTGVSEGTSSTAVDLVALARVALSTPALAEVVRTQTATLPDGTVVRNLDVLLSTNADWMGVKTGWTGAAGGCLMFAAQHTFASGTPPVTVFGAALGQPPDAAVDPDHPELGGAFAAARDAVAAALAGYAAVDVSATTPVAGGSLSEPWGAGTDVKAAPARTTVVAAIGQAVPLDVVGDHPGPAPARGTVVAHISGSLGGGHAVSWQVVTVDDVPAPSWWWHLLNG